MSSFIFSSSKGPQGTRIYIPDHTKMLSVDLIKEGGGIAHKQSYVEVNINK